VAQLVAALITVRGLLSFLSDVYGLLDPSGKMLWLSVDHRHLMTWFSFFSAFLTLRLPVVSRTGRTEYQLLLIEVETSSFR